MLHKHVPKVDNYLSIDFRGFQIMVHKVGNPEEMVMRSDKTGSTEVLIIGKHIVLFSVVTIYLL